MKEGDRGDIMKSVPEDAPEEYINMRDIQYHVTMLHQLNYYTHTQHTYKQCMIL